MVLCYTKFLVRILEEKIPPLQSLSGSVLIPSLHLWPLAMDHQIRAEQPSKEPAYWLIHY